MGKTTIGWTQESWNPARGCSRVSKGCEHCYAERMAARQLPGMRFGDGSPLAVMKSDGPHWTGRVELIPHMLDVPLHRRTPTIWFVNSMSDLFHENLKWAQIEQVFAVMQKCPQHTFQVLTKRADNAQQFAENWAFRHNGPLPNCWMGVSCEDQKAAAERVPLLLKTPAAVRFVSAEPLLGAVDFGLWLSRKISSDRQPVENRQAGIDWVIVGGESGPGARPMHPDWARSIRDECEAAGVPLFFKQWGAFSPTLPSKHAVNVARGDGTHHRMYRVGKKAAGHLLDGREWYQMPELKIRKLADH
jgi:protein gp37